MARLAPRRSLAPLAACAVAALALAGCDSARGPVTTTTLDAVEVEPGTTSDAMILLDDSAVDGTAIDAGGGALTPEAAAAARAEAEKAAAAEAEKAAAPEGADGAEPAAGAAPPPQ